MTYVCQCFSADKGQLLYSHVYLLTNYIMIPSLPIPLAAAHAWITFTSRTLSASEVATLHLNRKQLFIGLYLSTDFHQSWLPMIHFEPCYKGMPSLVAARLQCWPFCPPTPLQYSIMSNMGILPTVTVVKLKTYYRWMCLH